MSKKYPRVETVSDVRDEDTFGGFMEYLCEKNNKCDAIAILDLSDTDAEIEIVYQDPSKTSSIRVGTLEGLMRTTLTSAAQTINEEGIKQVDGKRSGTKANVLEMLQLHLSDLIIYAKRFDHQQWKATKDRVYIMIVNSENPDFAFFNVHKRTTIPLIEEALVRSKFLVF